MPCTKRGANAIARAAMLLAGAALPIAGQAASAPQKHTIESSGHKRTYYTYTPEAFAPAVSAPLVILFHGSGQNGLGVLHEWTGLANEQGFHVVAPNALNSLYWHIRADGPTFVRDLVESVAEKRAIDRRRIYLFGVSGGAVHALTLAMLESEYFASTAIFAGAWRERESFAALAAARRKIPVFIAAGDSDEFFPLNSVRTTERAIREAGHPVMLTILNRHGHSYRGVSNAINQAAWAFMKATALDADPKFQPYDST